ncbi:NACHT and TPR domain protein [Aspergillus californicus]
MAAAGQLSKIYQRAVDRYQEITHEILDVHFLQSIQTVDALINEIDKQNTTFKEFREKRKDICDAISLALVPVQRFMDLAGQGAYAFPPSCVVFGAVSCLIGAAQGVSTSYESIQDLMGSLKEFTVRLKTYSQEEISEDLSERLSEVLVALIEIFALSTKEVRRGRLRKFGRNLLLGSNDEIQAAVDKLDRLTRIEAGLVQAETLTIAKKTGRTVDDVAVTVTSTNDQLQETGAEVMKVSVQVTEVKDMLGNLIVSVNEKKQPESNKLQPDELRQILQPSKLDPAQTWYDKISKTRIPGTGDWILTEDIFNDWIQRNTPVIFVTGNPGAGKSYLSTNIISFLRSQHVKSNLSMLTMSVAYFYFKDDNPDTRSFHQALRDLAYQISMSDPAYQEHIAAIGDFICISTLETAWRRLFVEYFLEKKDVQSCVYIVFDGVDEASNKEREIFLGLARDIYQNNASCRLQLAIVGRPHLSDQLYESLEVEVPTIHVTAQKNSTDIDRYIKTSINKSAVLKRTSIKLRREILETLSAKAEGMFLWVNLMMQELVKRKSETSMRKSLKEAPRGLKEMFRHVLFSFSETCEPEELDFLNELLLWTACWKVPMTLQQAGDILRLKSADGDGMIYLEGALRKQWAAFFALDRADGLNTAELYKLALKSSGVGESDDNASILSHDEEDDENEGEMFEDVENFVNFDSYPYTTTVTFCHASIGDFFRDENEDRVSAGEKFPPVGVNWREAKVHVLKSCLRLLTEEEFAEKCAEEMKVTPVSAALALSAQLQSTPVSYATREDRIQIASLLVKVLTVDKYMELIGVWAGWAFTTTNVQAVRQWWEDAEVLDALDAEEREFVTDTEKNPATSFRLLAVYFWKGLMLGNKYDPAVASRAVWSYQKLLKNEEVDYTASTDNPTIEEVVSAAEFQDTEKTATWYSRVGRVLRDFKYLEASFEYFGKAQELGPEDPFILGGMGVLFVEQKEWQKAVGQFAQAEKAQLKMLETASDEQKTELEKFLHQLLEHMCLAYSMLGDYDNELAVRKRAFEYMPLCNKCINRILFHHHMNRQYEETIDLLKRMAQIPVPGRDFSILTITVILNAWNEEMFFKFCAHAALATNNIPFLIDTWSAMKSEARRLFETVALLHLDLSIARLYCEFAGNKAKAVSMWENIVDTFPSTREEGMLGIVKIQAAANLAVHRVSTAIDLGLGTPEAEEQAAELERLSHRLGNQGIKSDLWFTACAQSFQPGVYYRITGQHAKARAVLKPIVKRAVDILSDDEAQGEHGVAMGALKDVFTVLGDAPGTIATAYARGNYEDYPKSKRWQHEEDEVLTCCDGPCRISVTVYDGVSFCPICCQSVFCKNCVKLLEDGEMGINLCSAKHIEYFIHIPPRPQALEKSQMLVGDRVIELSKWLEELKAEWGL